MPIVIMGFLPQPQALWKRFWKGDIGDDAAIRQAFQGCLQCVHTAAGFQDLVAANLSSSPLDFQSYIAGRWIEYKVRA